MTIRVSTPRSKTGRSIGTVNKRDSLYKCADAQVSISKSGPNSQPPVLWGRSPDQDGPNVGQHLDDFSERWEQVVSPETYRTWLS
jgi:hypothetical protein